MIIFPNTMLSRAAGTSRVPGRGQPRIGDHDMPFRLKFTASTALATPVLASLVLTLVNRVEKLR